MSKGSILIYTSAAGQAAPLPGVTLTVTDAGGSVRARLVTDADGFAEAADLPAPDCRLQSGRRQHNGAALRTLPH